MTGQAGIPPSLNLKEDNHIHTRLCNHASGEMEEYVLAALKAGLERITFLEHLEADIRYFERTWLTQDDFAYYFEEGDRLREVYRDRLEIRLGVEVGYNPYAVERIREKLAGYPWDRMGLSYHFFFDGNSHLNMVSRRQGNIDALAALGPEKVVTGYFEGLIQGVQELDCDVLCHLDAVMRHHPDLQLQPSHLEQIESLLQAMRNKRMMLEVNTSGFPLRDAPYPNRTIIMRALELGIPLTAGSDAHHPGQVGREFDRLPRFISGR